MASPPPEPSQPVASTEARLPKNKGEKKQVLNVEREPGKSLLPFSRVQKIIKADRDLPIVAKEATFLISIATEDFIKRITEASRRLAERERRSTVQHKDIANVVRKADEFMFLEEIIPFTAPDPLTRKKPKTVTEKMQSRTMLDQFVSFEAGSENMPGVIINEDGTMVPGEEEVRGDM